jgi:hypothetical protein
VPPPTTTLKSSYQDTDGPKKKQKNKTKQNKKKEKEKGNELKIEIRIFLGDYLKISIICVVASE